MKVTVVHVKDFGKKSKNLENNGLYIYCGRPSKFSNPFEIKEESQREHVIEQFTRQAFPYDDISDLIAYCEKNNIEYLNLGCYCSPKACHCDEIKKFIDKGAVRTFKFKELSFSEGKHMTIRVDDGSINVSKGDRIILESNDGNKREKATIDEVIHIRFHQLRNTHVKYLPLQTNPSCRTYESLHQCMSTYYQKDVENEPVWLIVFRLDKFKGLFDE